MRMGLVMEYSKKWCSLKVLQDSSNFSSEQFGSYMRMEVSQLEVEVSEWEKSYNNCLRVYLYMKFELACCQQNVLRGGCKTFLRFHVGI